MVIFFLRGLVLLAAVAGVSAGSLVKASTRQEATGMKIILSQDLGNHRVAELRARQLSLKIGSGVKAHTISGKFLWLDIKDEHTGKTSHVWREWFATSKTNSSRLRDFIIFQRKKEEIALVFVEGPNIRFWQINLNTSVDVDPKAAVDYVKSVARIALFINTPTNIPVPQMLKAVKAGSKPPKILAVAWKEGQWQVQALVDNKQIIFARGPSETKWQLMETHIAAARTAERSFHAACDEWSAAQGKGEDTSPAAAKITRSYHDFMRHIRKTKFTPNAANLVPEEFAGAGKLESAGGDTWSYVVGKGQSGLIMSLWKRIDWQAHLPAHGLAASLGIEPLNLVSKFSVGTATWADPKQQNLLRVPYKLNGTSGVIEIRRIGDRWEMKPDRGVVAAGGWWRPGLEGENSTQKEAEVEIYRKTFKDVGDLVVIREPDRSVSEFSNMLPKEVSKEDIRSLFNVRIELHPRNARSLTLATLLRSDMKRQGGYEVLDALFDNGKFVIATAQNGLVVITRIRPTRYEPVVAVSLRRWTDLAAWVRIDHTMVNVKLNLTKEKVKLSPIEEKLVEVEVDDLRPNSRKHTRFLQKPDEWKFQKVGEERR